ncbi:MAG: carbamoyl phosphate synthase large subunit, partial [Acidobacteriota bacterium]
VDDVEALSDGERVFIAGVMEHFAEAGILSGDRTCVLPPIMVQPVLLERMKSYTRRLGTDLRVIGLMNIQFAVKDGVVYVLEVNPRASRTVPYVSKATGVPLAKVAARVMAGEKLSDLGLHQDLQVSHCFVKSPVFPFNKFPKMDRILGPEMISTGEVMGVADDFGTAFGKAQMAAGIALPLRGDIFVSVNENDKAQLIPLAREFQRLGFGFIATSGTRQALVAHGIPAVPVFKVGEGRPNIVDCIKNGEVDLIINTPLGRQSRYDEKAIRRAATQHSVPCITTLSGAKAAASAVQALRARHLSIRPIQEYHRARQHSEPGVR